MISVKECQEAGLGTGGAFHATETYVVSGAFEVPQIPQQFLRSYHCIQSPS